ncbi:dTDP-4-dehydrorhamnose reductase [Psychromonas ingrahamii 37]|uniref:dTDP-4-dehydrorhamnose reductase n=1 Tax=Psychromonas ingrahamii (strain DSM 17664 / CCUG 51855 / 37) TaxID=357804 RepID=A1ST19_PSYIN|nr:SDR family oxidoreductase [Psychromonas ingrahamii]ABM02634.1 dTDP-4-dehydrorhamnose reductase [Psychromonas ingrahamii 37]
MKVLIIGATGMLGYSLFQNLCDVAHLDVYGTVRSIKGKEPFFSDCEERLFKGVDVSDLAAVEAVIKEIKPDVVINCIGLIKQHSISKQHVDAVAINSLLPHQLASLCDSHSCKLIHFSTDCIFDGKKGFYTEEDTPDALDLYGRSKCLGEVDSSPHLTLRTSIIGHELDSAVSLVDWFLSQENSTKGFSKAIFSGLPTCVIARLLIEKILPASDLSGLYQLSVDPIDKFTLLNLVADIYNKKIEIIESKELKIDRSLNSKKLRDALSLEIPSWKSLISEMHNDYENRYEKYRCKN